MNFFKTFFCCAAALSATLSYGQQQPKLFGKTISSAKINPVNNKIRCASTEYNDYLRELNPQSETTIQFEQWITEKNAERLARRSPNTVITIPVVVHVIHNGDAIGVNENITDAQVLSQITVLNQDFRKMVDTPGFNTNPVGADTEIQFALAVVDPNGNPTNGIDRVQKSSASWGESSIESSLKPTTIWDPNKYFNIWVCNFGADLTDVLGYAQFPSSSGLGGLNSFGGSANTDGVIISYKYFGSSNIYPQGTYEWPYDEGRTTTHEVGHALGLRHIDGDNSSCTINGTDSFKDFCPDTPATSELNFFCSTTNSCPSAAGNDMIENYMDYTPDGCMNIFTQNQKNRMLTVLQNSPRRASLLTSNVHILSTTDFSSAVANMSIYPNPANDVLNVNSPEELPDALVIYNSLGQVMSDIRVDNLADLQINTSAYSSGIYFLHVNKGNENKVFKFIKS